MSLISLHYSFFSLIYCLPLYTAFPLRFLFLRFDLVPSHSLHCWSPFQVAREASSFGLTCGIQSNGLILLLVLLEKNIDPTPLKLSSCQSPSKYTKSQETLNCPPLHENITTFNPQTQSPLFSPTFPPELRNQIFALALAPYQTSEYPPNVHYNRPSHRGPTTQSLSLISVCRRVYLETHHLPLTLAFHNFSHCAARGPPSKRIIYDDDIYAQETDYFSKFTPYQISLIKSLTLYTQLWWLETQFSILTQESFMQGIENLTICVRRGDWWWNEQNVKLVMEWNKFKHSFKEMKGLKRLVMMLESSDDKRNELLGIVEQAKKRRFRLAGGGVLVPREEVGEMVWQSGFNYWSNICPYCHINSDCIIPAEEPDPRCVERVRLRSLRLGPKCHIFTVQWRVGNEREMREFNEEVGESDNEMNNEEMDEEEMESDDENPGFPIDV